MWYLSGTNLLELQNSPLFVIQCANYTCVTEKKHKHLHEEKWEKIVWTHIYLSTLTFVFLVIHKCLVSSFDHNI